MRLILVTFLASKLPPLESFFTQLRAAEEFSKSLGSGRLDEGRRALETGRDGSLGGKSLGLSTSSLRRRESSISSIELRAIIDGDTDNISLSQTSIVFSDRLKSNSWHCWNLVSKAWSRSQLKTTRMKYKKQETNYKRSRTFVAAKNT